MNKLLAFAQKRIPYIPELKSLCDGSIPATILMMQMEYWFASHPDGFYKFLKPCEHEKYHPGDSWTEELQFSEHEFRASFEKIGVRYKSKTQLEQVPPGVDIFQGHYYLSYFDTRKSMTVYLRNHALIDEKLDALLDGFRAQPIRKKEQVTDSNKDANFQSPGIESFNLRRLKKSISGDEKIQSAYIGTDITTQDYKHTAAADERSPKIENALIDENQNRHDPGFAAAVIEKNFPQAHIGKTLTTLQEEQVFKACEHLSKIFPHLNAKPLCEEITFALLSPQIFTQAGRDFFKKLNTITKCIREGRWTRPSQMLEEEAKKIDENVRELQIQQRELEGECAHWKQMIELFEGKNDPEQLNVIRHQHQKASDALKKFTTEHMKNSNLKEVA